MRAHQKFRQIAAEWRRELRRPRDNFALQTSCKSAPKTKLQLNILQLQDILSKPAITPHTYQCWTEGLSSTAVAEGLGPTATVAEVLGHSYGQRFYGSFLRFFQNGGRNVFFITQVPH